jgi:hypothetical protein
MQTEPVSWADLRELGLLADAFGGGPEPPGDHVPRRAR